MSTPPSHGPLGYKTAANTAQAPKVTAWGMVKVFDKDPVRGNMIAGRIREEIERPLARRLREKYRVTVVPREAAVSDVRSLAEHDVIVAVLGKGGEETAMKLFGAGPWTFETASAKAKTKARFSVLGGGITMGRVAIVPVAAASPFGGDETLIGNIGAHEFGHAISKLGEKIDHTTSGLMVSEISTDDPVLHFTATFLAQF